MLGTSSGAVAEIALHAPAGLGRSVVLDKWYSIFLWIGLSYTILPQGYKLPVDLYGWRPSISTKVPPAVGSVGATQTGTSLACSGLASWQHAQAILISVWQSWYPLFPGLPTGHTCELR